MRKKLATRVFKIRAKSDTHTTLSKRGGPPTITTRVFLQVAAVAESQPFDRYMETKRQERIAQSVALYQGCRVDGVTNHYTTWQDIVTEANEEGFDNQRVYDELVATGLVDAGAPHWQQPG